MGRPLKMLRSLYEALYASQPYNGTTIPVRAMSLGAFSVPECACAYS